MMNNFWNERYSDPEYAYGESPNEFVKQELCKLKPGKVLFPAEGEGRNAVYAATLGWDVTAFDPSSEGKKKATQLSSKHNVKINYHIADYQNVQFPVDSFDCICFTFCHMPGNIRRKVHSKLTTYLKPGGTIILEGFSKNQMNKTSGGPRSLDFLFDKNELDLDFAHLSSINLIETEINLDEGPFHQGAASVIRIVGKK